MIIGGVEKLTTIDFPGKLAAIIFTQGCNFRCQFCYNPMLVWPIEDSRLKYQKDHLAILESDFFAFLESRRGKLDGVVISGGEPTLHPDLPDFISKIKTLGYAVKLDTNGTNPVMLEQILNFSVIPGRSEAKGKGISGEDSNKIPAFAGMTNKLVDYLAMDIKAPLEKYEQVVSCPVNLDNIKKSIELIKNSGLPYEFRTTLVPGLHTFEDIAKMGQLISDHETADSRGASSGVSRWYLQFFKSDTPLVNRDMEAKDKFTHAEMEAMAVEGRRWVGVCEVRG
jgi:pyruvate formate lyase activating enzyme